MSNYHLRKYIERYGVVYTKNTFGSNPQRVHAVVINSVNKFIELEKEQTSVGIITLTGSEVFMNANGLSLHKGITGILYVVEGTDDVLYYSDKMFHSLFNILGSKYRKPVTKRIYSEYVNN